MTQAGHDAVHVRAIQLQHADDMSIVDRAASDDRIVVSAGTDFGALLATRRSLKPSVIQFRGRGSREPGTLARTVLSNVAQIQEALEIGSIVTFEPSRIRVRALPINVDSIDV